MTKKRRSLPNRLDALELADEEHRAAALERSHQELKEALEDMERVAEKLRWAKAEPSVNAPSERLRWALTAVQQEAQGDEARGMRLFQERIANDPELQRELQLQAATPSIN